MSQIRNTTSKETENKYKNKFNNATNRHKLNKSIPGNYNYSCISCNFGRQIGIFNNSVESFKKIEIVRHRPGPEWGA
jgi:hypothetical protein